MNFVWRVCRSWTKVYTALVVSAVELAVDGNEDGMRLLTCLPACAMNAGGGNFTVGLGVPSSLDASKRGKLSRYLFRGAWYTRARGRVRVSVCA